jgi:pilus assembly protein CpaC
MQGSALVPRQRLPANLLAGRALVLLVAIGGTDSPAAAQGPDQARVEYSITKPGQRLEMTVNTSQVLKLRKKIPRLFVADPAIVQATPLAPDQVQLAALAPGVTQVNLWDEQGAITTVDVMVSPDAAQLRELLASEFPDANLRVRPLAKSVYITGYVPRPEMVHEITTFAKDYYRDVISGVVVGGVQQVALHVKVMEVSRTKLRQLGLDWRFIGDNGFIEQGAGGLLAQVDAGKPVGAGGDTIRFAIFGDASAFLGYLQALRSQDLVKILSEPTLVTMTGRPATFLSGGSFPIIVPSGLGNYTVQWRTYGTQVDFVPVVLGDGTIRLEVRGSVSELDPARGAALAGTVVPGITERNVDTSVEMQAGQSLALAGLLQNRVESQNRGVPFLADVPLVGRFFSRVEEKTNEVELLVIVTPELIAPLDPHQLPQCGPGQVTVSPDDNELYCYGYLEVPNCGLAGPATGSCGAPVPLGFGAGLPPAEMRQSGSAAPPDPLPPRRLESIPRPQPTAPGSPNNAIAPPGPNAAPPPASLSPANATEARRPALYGPIGYEPLP